MLHHNVAGLWGNIIGFNSLWNRDAIWWHRAESTLVQVMAWGLLAPSLNKTGKYSSSTLQTICEGNPLVTRRGHNVERSPMTWRHHAPIVTRSSNNTWHIICFCSLLFGQPTPHHHPPLSDDQVLFTSITPTDNLNWSSTSIDFWVNN